MDNNTALTLKKMGMDFIIGDSRYETIVPQILEIHRVNEELDRLLRESARVNQAIGEELGQSMNDVGRYTVDVFNATNEFTSDIEGLDDKDKALMSAAAAGATAVVTGGLALLGSGINWVFNKLEDRKRKKELRKKRKEIASAHFSEIEKVINIINEKLMPNISDMFNQDMAQVLDLRDKEFGQKIMSPKISFVIYVRMNYLVELATFIKHLYKKWLEEDELKFTNLPNINEKASKILQKYVNRDKFKTMLEKKEMLWPAPVAIVLDNPYLLDAVLEDSNISALKNLPKPAKKVLRKNKLYRTIVRRKLIDWLFVILSLLGVALSVYCFIYYNVWWTILGVVLSTLAIIVIYYAVDEYFLSKKSKCIASL